MGLKTFVPGESLTAGDLNDSFKGSGKLLQVYTGDGFDSSMSGAGTDTDSHELTAISASELGSAKYLLIEFTGIAGFSFSSGNLTGTNSLKIETKDVGGSYSGSLPLKTIQTVGYSARVSTLIRYSHIHELTNDEIANGIQIRMTSQAVCAGDSPSASVSNYQTTISTLY